MSGVDGLSPGIKSFADQRQDANSVDSQIAELNQQLGFSEPKDVKPPFIPGAQEPPQIEPPADPAVQKPAPDAAAPVADAPAQPANTSAAPPVETDLEALTGAGKMLGKGVAFAAKTAKAVALNSEQFGSGVYHVAQNIGNAVNEAQEAVQNWLQKSGIDIGTFSAEDRKITFADALIQPPKTDDEKLAYNTGKMLTEFAGFVGGGEMVQGGKIAVAAGRMATGFAMNFAAFDPHQKRLSDYLNENAALHNSFVSYLASKPDEGEAEGRFKNALEGLITDVGLSTALAALGKTYKAFSGLKSEVLPEVKSVAQEAESGALKSGSEFKISGEAGAVEVPPTTEQAARGDAVSAAEAGAEDAKGTVAEAQTQSADVPPGEALNGDNTPAPPAPKNAELPEVPSRSDLAGQKEIPLDEIVREVPPQELSSAGKFSMGAVEQDGDVQQTVKNLVEFHKEAIETAARGIVSDVTLLNAAGKIAAEDAGRILGFPVGRAMSAEEIAATTMLLNQGASELAAAANKIIESGGSAESMAELARVRSTTSQIVVQWGAAGSEAGRALRARQVLAKSGNIAERAKIAASLIQNDASPREAMRTAMMIKQVMENPNIDKVRWLANFAKKSTGEKLGDVVLTGWVNGMLSRPTTVAKVVAAGTATTLMRPLERLGAYAVGDLRRDLMAGPGVKVISQGVSGQEVGQSMVGMWEGFKDGLNLIHATLEGNFTPGHLPGTPALQKVGENALSGRLWDENNPIARGIAFLSHTAGAENPEAINQGIRSTLDAAGNLQTLPGKALMTAHDFVRTVNYRMEVQALAARSASHLGLEGEAFAQHVEGILSNPPDALKIAADANAREAAFASPLTGFAAKAEDFVRAFPGRGKVIAPFMRIAGNVVNYALNRNPIFGALSSSAAGQWLGIGKELQAELAAGGIRSEIQQGKLAAGGALMGLASWMALDGHITGGGPVDPKANARLRETGWQPYSVVIPGESGPTYHPYHAIEGVGGLFKMATDLTQLYPYLNNEKTKDSYALAGAALMFRAVTPDFISRNLHDVLNAMNDPERGKNFITQFGRTAVPGILNQGNKAFGDNVKRVVKAEPSSAHPIWDELMNQARSQIPGLSSDLLPQRDRFGEPIYYPDGHGPETLSPIAMVNPFKSSANKNDPVRNEIIRLGMAGAFAKEEAPAGESYLKIDNPAQVLTKKDPLTGVSLSVHLTNEQYDKYSQLAAGIGLRTGFQDDDGNIIPLNEREKTIPTLHEAMEQKVKEFGENNVSDLRRKLDLKKMDTMYKQAAKSQLFEEDPEIRQKFMEIHGASVRAAQTPGPGPDKTGTLQGVSQ